MSKGFIKCAFMLSVEAVLSLEKTLFKMTKAYAQLNPLQYAQALKAVRYLRQMLAYTFSRVLTRVLGHSDLKELIQSICTGHNLQIRISWLVMNSVVPLHEACQQAYQ